MDILGSSSGLAADKKEAKKKSKLIEYGIAFSVVGVCLVVLFSTVGQQAANDWTALKSNLDPDWTPPEASQQVEAQTQTVFRTRFTRGTAGGDD